MHTTTIFLSNHRPEELKRRREASAPLWPAPLSDDNLVTVEQFLGCPEPAVLSQRDN